jgi:hypothetical protein
MARQCERPGCSNPANVTYGFEAAGAMVWLAPLSDDQPRRDLVGVLCRRHADALRPPRGWWLDDRRVTAPRLFTVVAEGEATEVSVEPPAPGASTADHGSGSVTRPARKRRRRVGDDTEELLFDFAGPSESATPTGDAASAPSGPAGAPSDPEGPAEPPSSPGAATTTGPDGLDPDETKALPWTPVFDRGDDLGGVLAASSPLLSRAFGLRRPKA